MQHEQAQAAALERIAAAIEPVLARARSGACVTHQDCTDLWADLLVVVTEVSRGSWGRALDGTGSTLAWGEPLEAQAVACVAEQRDLLRRLADAGRVYPPDPQPAELIVEDSTGLLATVLLAADADTRAWATSAYDQFLTELPHLVATIAYWIDAFEPTSAGMALINEAP